MGMAHGRDRVGGAGGRRRHDFGQGVVGQRRVPGHVERVQAPFQGAQDLVAPGVGDGQLVHHPEQDLEVEGQGQGVLVDHDQVGAAPHVMGGVPGRGWVAQVGGQEPVAIAPGTGTHDGGHGHGLHEAGPIA